MPHHVFISYAHLDNVPAQGDAKGWITNFQDALNSFLGQYYDETPIIWRDPKIAGNMRLQPTVFGNLLQSSTLVSVLSPRYMASDWCNDELETFCREIDIYVGDRTRVFKVLKTQVPLAGTPPVFHDTTGYQFYESTASGNPVVLNPDFGPEYKAKFLLKVSDLAFDIAELLKELRNRERDAESVNKTVADLPGEEPPAPKSDGLYLALPPPDLWEQYHNIRRDLLHRKIRVLPASFDVPRRSELESFRETVRENLRQSKLAVHLLDKNSLEQAGDEHSYVNIQMKLAAEREAAPNFSRLIWLGEELRADDKQVQNFISRIVEPSASSIDVLPTTLETFKTAILDAFAKEPAPISEPKSAADARKVYVLYDKTDADSAQEIEQRLFDDFGCEVLPASDYLFLSGEGGAKEIIETHNQYLRECDGVLIYWRSPFAPWVRAKLSDLQKAKGLERQTDFRAKGVYLDGDLAVKSGFRTHEAMILKSRNDLPQFVRQLGNGGQN